MIQKRIAEFPTVPGESPETRAYRALTWLAFQGGCTAVLSEADLRMVDKAAIIAVAPREALPSVLEAISKVRTDIIRALGIIAKLHDAKQAQSEAKQLTDSGDSGKPSGGSRVPAPKLPPTRPSPAIANPF